MPEFMIRNVPVHFPFEPYDVQKDYMEKVIDCLQSRAHGMLESPTGTGKTLSLLCSSLAWLTLKKAQMQAMRLTTNDDSAFMEDLKDSLDGAAGSSVTNQPTSWGRFAPKIIYSSRTHSQLSQAISELKRTNYSHLKMAIIGSRDQLCTHSEVSKEENTSVKTAMCQTLLKARSCSLHKNIERKKTDPAFTEAGVMDIEDLIKVSDKLKVCPYFMSRELKQSADIIFMPYNYLLDPRVRKLQDVDISNSVIILDEGHNVEKICEDSASYSLSNTDVAMCISEITSVMKMFSEIPVDFYNENEKRDFSENELMLVKEMLLNLEKAIDSIHLSLKNNTEAEFPGEYIFDLMEKASVTADSYATFVVVIDQIVQYLNTINSKGPFQRTGGHLDKLATFFKIVFQFERMSADDHKRAVRECYRVFVTLEKPKFQKKKDTWLANIDAESKPGGKVVNFWCFNPAHGMKGLLSLGVHSIIVTSGTLSPLPPLISELGIPINITLENGHVIGQDQVFVTVVKQGPDNVPLTSTFKNRSNDSYLASLGRTIVNFARIIPEGLLVFFPSYTVLNQCKEFWEERGIWGQIFALKEIFIEPQGKRDLKDVMNAYYARINEPGSKGACFFAVCRGKVSEGLDFSDQNGRAVILTGLPYPPFFDPRVQMKRDYLDKNKKKVSGQNWYQLEATRAVNQAVGRVIRHRHDYGAVIFCDSRFGEQQIKQQMSAWLRPYIQTPQQFGAVTRGLGQFFKQVKEKLPQPVKKEMSAAWGGSSSDSIASQTMSASFDTSSKWLSASKKPGTSLGNFKWSNQNLMSPSTFTPSYSQSTVTLKKAKSEPKTMFGALEETAEVIDFNAMRKGESSQSEAENTYSGFGARQEDRGGCPPEAKRKKLRVMGVSLSYENEASNVHVQSMSTTCSSCPDERKKKMLAYLKTVRESLTKEEMGIFNAAVKSYSKESNLEELLKVLDRIFNKPKLLSCLQGFDDYIKVHHKEKFAAFCSRKIENCR